jgi:hypothetical protein
MKFSKRQKKLNRDSRLNRQRLRSNHSCWKKLYKKGTGLPVPFLYNFMHIQTKEN